MHQPNRGVGPKKEAERDFVALNKASVECGLTTAHEQMQFRATHDIRRRDEERRRSSTVGAKFPEDMVFGISTRSHRTHLWYRAITTTLSLSLPLPLSLSLYLSLSPLRPSTPVFDLLEHRYGDRWLEERREAEKKQRQKNNKKVYT